MLRLVGGLLMVIVGLWVFLPGRSLMRSQYNEVLKTSCTLTSGAVLRLYEGGRPPGALWYTVSIDRGALHREREFFHASDHPVLTALECADERLTLVAQDQVFSFGETQIVDELIDRPRRLYKGEPQEHRPSPMGLLLRFVGLLIAVLGARLMWHSRRNDPRT